MSYYRTCPHCGAHLDPGERCGCLAEFRELLGELTPENRERAYDMAKAVLRAQKETAAGAANTDDGKERDHTQMNSRPHFTGAGKENQV